MKPMLAAPAGDRIKYPKLLSPKLDGIRCLIIDGIACGRSLKPIPNKHVQALFGRKKLNGLDGELVVGSAVGEGVFQRTSSGVMSIKGEPDVWFWVFDDFTVDGWFIKRLGSAMARSSNMGPLCNAIMHDTVTSDEQIDEHESHYLKKGFEGVMLRDPKGPYKYGRSTTKEEWLLKLKRFEDSEAIVTGWSEFMHNTNEAMRNELGQLERSSKKEGKVGKGMLGSLMVRDLKTGVEFDIGTGFTKVQRSLMWNARDTLSNTVVKYKFQPVGVKDKPRFPVFMGFRNPVDM